MEKVGTGFEAVHTYICATFPIFRVLPTPPLSSTRDGATGEPRVFHTISLQSWPPEGNGENGGEEWGGEGRGGRGGERWGGGGGYKSKIGGGSRRQEKKRIADEKRGKREGGMEAERGERGEKSEV